MLIKKIEELEKKVEILEEEEKLRLIANIIFIILVYLHKQENITPFALIPKLTQHLNLAYQEKLLKDINFIIDSYYNQISTKTIDNSEIIGAILDRLRNGAAIDNPAPDESDRNEIVEMKPLEPLSNNYSSCIPFNEGLQYIVPVFTDKAMEAIKNKSESKQTLDFLSKFNNKNSIKDVYLKSFPKINIFQYVKELISFSKQGFFNFRKSSHAPLNKRFKVQLGDLLISMNLLTAENLKKLLLIQAGESKMMSVEDNNLIIVSTLPSEKFYLQIEKKLLGDLLLEFNLISNTDLSKALNIFRWYNSIFITERH